MPPSPTPKIDGDRAEGQSSIRERGESLKFLPLNTHCLLNTLKLDSRFFLGWWRVVQVDDEEIGEEKRFRGS